jgi:hypothetical protein
MTTIYGGRNDRALVMVSEAGLPDTFFMRAQWAEFEKSLAAAEDGVDDEVLAWFGPAWAVKLRGVAPQKPATDKIPKFVEMLDWLKVPWREMERRY